MGRPATLPARKGARHPMRWLIAVFWVALAVLAASLYGAINDQITATLAPEYFSVFKRHEFWWLLEEWGLVDAPTRIQAVAVGIAATWWFGLALGVALAIAGVAGRPQGLSTRSFLAAIDVTMLVTAGCSAVFGAAAYLLAPAIRPTPQNWPFLEGITRVRAAFAVGWWHNGAYLGALIGTIAACRQARRRASAV